MDSFPNDLKIVGESIFFREAFLFAYDSDQQELNKRKHFNIYFTIL